jgi:antitoxin FitA
MVPFRIYNETMARNTTRTVTLSVKDVPIDLADRLKKRAANNHRSLQGELRAILEDAGRTMTVGEIMALVKRLGLKTPSESAKMIREDRDDPGR